MTTSTIIFTLLGMAVQALITGIANRGKVD